MGEIGDCPLCFGRLLPLSACQSCNSVVARDGLTEVDPTIVCVLFGAHWITSSVKCRNTSCKRPPSTSKLNIGILARMSALKILLLF